MVVLEPKKADDAAMRLVELCNEHGNSIGTEEIIAAHTGEGKLHRAFSVYIFRNNRTEILVQQRSAQKLLFKLLWANTCCSHPFPNEDTVSAGMRRLKEECGIAVPSLQQKGVLVYRAKDPNSIYTEYEHDALLTGDVDTITPHPDPNEIAALEWRKLDELEHDMQEYPNKYAPWFHLGLEKLLHC